MLENLFSSKVLFSVLTVLFENSERSLSTPEIIKLSKKQQANVLRELEKLVKWDMVIKRKNGNQNFYELNKNNSFYSELKDLFKKFKNQQKPYVYIMEENGGALLSMDYFFKGYHSDLAVKEGVMDEVPKMIFLLKNNYFWTYVDGESARRVIRGSIERFLKDSNFVKKIYKATKGKGEMALSIYDDLIKRKFDINPEKAVKLIDDFIDITGTQISLNHLAAYDLLDFPYSNYLNDYLKKQSKNTDFRVNYLLEKLLAPEELTMTQKLRIEILNLVLDYKSKDFKYINRLKDIQERWKWLNYNYRGPVLGLDYFENIFNELLNKDSLELEGELRELSGISERAAKEKAEIFKKVNVDKKHKNLIQSLSALSFLKLYRKDTAFLVIYMTHQIAGRFIKNIPQKNWLYLTLDELKETILGKKEIGKKTLAEREKKILIDHNDEILTGKVVDDYMGKNIQKDSLEEEGESLKLLDGQTACLGKTGDWVHGKVKIINSPEDMPKMEEGDILVSYATTPDILQAMKKASAIVTDQGGITCHAAIVSRELNIPCLIGTKYATKVFKDGDEVTVCPRHGNIKFK